MKFPNVEIFLNQKKAYSHIVILLISICIGVFSFIIREEEWDLGSQLKMWILTFIYIEVFILLSSVFFNRTTVDTTNKNFLRNILSRFFLFYISCFCSALVVIILFRYFDYVIHKQHLGTVLSDFMQEEFTYWFTSTTKGLTLGAIIFLYFQ